ncbi:tetratricopeptide repeat protein [Sphaerothrix gracilis]|uniref:tetratricopeptide repeat protein n=1 Tax=Sphaerothrix gracilis TaxID=3151835 RepID=UPI0031FD300F
MKLGSPKRFRAYHFCLCGVALLGVTLGISQTGTAPLAAYAQTNEESLAQGYRLLAQDRVSDAIALFESIVRQRPNSVEALQGLGIAYRRAGQDANALATYQRIIEIDPDNQLALSTLGYLGEFRPEWQPLGISALTRLLQITPNALEARAQRAKLYYYQGRFPQALADYALVLPRTSDPNVLRPAAEAYTFSGDPTSGLALFERYLAAGGKIQADTAIAYAQALRDSGQLSQSAQVLEQELRRTPEFNTLQIRLRGALASTYAASRQFQAALNIVQPLRGRTDSRLTLARALNAVGSYSDQADYRREAAALYQAVLTSGDGVTPGLQREALSVFSTLPAYRAAAAQLAQQLAQTFPEDSSLALQQQVLAYQTGSLSQANFVQQVRAAFPNLPADPVQVRYMSQTLSRLDPPLVELLPLYQSLAATSGTEPFLNFRLAQLYAQQGQYANARSALAAYTATPAGRQDTPTAELLLADLDRRAGNVAQSAQRYQALLASAPTQTVRNAAAQGLATLYQGQGRWSEAIAIYNQLIAENPQNFAYQINRAATAYQAGLITEAQAEAVLQQGLQQATPSESAELVALATALPPSASRAGLYRQLLAVDPSNAQLQLRSLQVLAEASPRQAQAQIAQLIAQNPTAIDFYFVQGEIAQQVGDYDLAQQSYLAIRQQQPNNLDALLALAGLEFQRGNYQQADALYEQVLAVNPDSSTALTSLAALNAVQGYPLLAIQQLRRWQQTQQAQGTLNPQVAEQIQQIGESLLQQRGIQPYWERF